jgi:3-dehydroquinate dehydratase/shikimate dehydrogenase
MTKVVETFTAANMAELRRRCEAGTIADLVELRLDGIHDLDVAGALAGRRTPVIVTCRPVWEGGRFDGSEEERGRILTQAAALGADFIDLEWQADRRLLAACRPARVVLSSHDFEGVPPDLTARVRDMRGAGADMIKVAVTARSLTDCVVLKDASASEEPHVALAMGPSGHLSRLWPAWLGSHWTYSGDGAPGQLPTRDLIGRYRVRDTTTATAVYGVVGQPLGHSASPAMHNAAFAALGIDAVYLPLETSSAPDFFTAAKALGLTGASVTIPMKTALLTSAVKTDDLPERIGALNTLRRTPAGWEGRNFDGAGFLEPFCRRSIPLCGRRAVVLGAGGAARAVVWALAAQGANVEILARRSEQAASLAREFRASVSDSPLRPGWDVLINTTPLGTTPRVDECPVGDDAFVAARGKVVYDLVYNPAETTLLRKARAAGAETIGGLEMLVSQACRQFEWWTGQPAPRDVMERAATGFLYETDNIR